MLQRTFGFSLSRFALGAALLAAIAGCNQAETSLYGSIDVVPSGVRDAACDAVNAGRLQLDGIEVADVVNVSSEELCHNWIVRKELPAGLYEVSWRAHDERVENKAPWPISKAGIVNVFPNQTTTVRVLREDPDPRLLSQVPPAMDAVDQW